MISLRAGSHAVLSSLQDVPLRLLTRKEADVEEEACGHLTEEMTELYSSVGQDEVRGAMEKVVSLGGYREIFARGSRGGKGAEVGQGCEKGYESDPSDEGATELPEQVAVKLSFS
jgi:hypothetical protein